MIVPIAGQEIPARRRHHHVGQRDLRRPPSNIAKDPRQHEHPAAGGTFKVTILRAGQILELTGKAP